MSTKNPRKLENGVIVITRKNLSKKTTKTVLKETKNYVDPSYGSEKPKNPLDFEKTSFVKTLMAKPLWENVKISPSHIRNLFGEPNRICSDHIEWSLRIPERNVLKIVVNNRGRVSIHGFQRNRNVERWVERLFNS